MTSANLLLFLWTDTYNLTLRQFILKLSKLWLTNTHIHWKPLNIGFMNMSGGNLDNSSNNNSVG